MRYIHDGEVRNRTIDPPKRARFVFSEPTSHGRGRTNTAVRMADVVAKMRGNAPLVIGHE